MSIDMLIECLITATTFHTILITHLMKTIFIKTESFIRKKISTGLTLAAKINFFFQSHIWLRPAWTQQ